MINKINDTFLYLKTKDVQDLSGVSSRTLADRCAKNCYIYRFKKDGRGGKNGKQYEILFSSLEPEIQQKIKKNKPELFSTNEVMNCSHLPHMPIVFENSDNVSMPQKARDLALAKVALIELWQDFRNNKKDKKQADKDFIDLCKNKLIAPKLLVTLKNVSLSSLYRWKKDYEETKSYKSLMPAYNYGSSSKIITTLSPIEQDLLLKILLNSKQFKLGRAYELLKYKLEDMGVEQMASYSAYRRYVEKYKANNYDEWVYAREGKKVLGDKILPYISRDTSKIKVGDVLIADGNKLDFMVLNPFTGKPCRATLVLYLDWKSWDIAGYEIMVSENTQAIASALRNSILRLGKIPIYSYQDNGAAFRGKYFTGSNDFREDKVFGIFRELGITPIFAQAYNGKAKPVERFFKEFAESFAPLVCTYIGNSISKKPAQFKRNEKFHKDFFTLMQDGKPYCPSIQEVAIGFENWLNKIYRKRKCPHIKGKTIGEVFNEGKGPGVNVEMLDELIMMQETRKLFSNGVRLFYTNYWDERLYGLKGNVIVRYSLFDLTSVKIYSLKGEFICNASRMEALNPLANYEGDEKDVYALKKRISQVKKLHNQTVSGVKNKICAPNQSISGFEGPKTINPKATKNKKTKYKLLPLDCNKTIELPLNQAKKEYRLI